MAKQYIDPRYFAVFSGNIPGYAVPDKCVPHLVLLDDHTTPLCGMGKPGERMGHKRVYNAEKTGWKHPICGNCIKAAAEQGLVEQPPLKLREGDCPVRSEREGKRKAHNWIARRPRCKNCPPQDKYKYTERCGGKHPTYAWCNFCEAKDESRHYCDLTIGRDRGRWTDFGPCNLPAKDFEHHKGFYTAKGKVWGWLCHLHNAAGEKKRADKYAAERAAEQARWDARDKRDEDERNAIKLLAEVARWIAANRELAAEDEWLRKIAEDIAGNDLVMEKLNKKGRA